MRKLDRLKETPSQTAGPYLHIGCLPSKVGINFPVEMNLGSVLASENVKGKKITVGGKVFDGKNNPIKDGMVEIWQADADGIYKSNHSESYKSDPNFNGWGRSCCDFETGLWEFKTIKPGPVMLENGQFMAPHISFWFVARGINLGLNTRMYFSDEEFLNKSDLILKKIKRKTKIETLMGIEITPNYYEFNIYLQGSSETIFFEI